MITRPAPSGIQIKKSCAAEKRLPFREVNLPVPKMQKMLPPRQISKDCQPKIGQGKVTRQLAISNLTKSQLFSNFENLTLKTEKVENQFEEQKTATESETHQNLQVVSESIKQVEDVLPRIKAAEQELSRILLDN